MFFKLVFFSLTNCFFFSNHSIPTITSTHQHHCRNCGAVVCGSCSKNKFLIPSQSSKPVRVCNTCFDSLGKNRISIKRDSKSSDELVVNQKDKDQVLNVAAPPLVTALPAEISAQNEDQKPNEDDDSSESDSEERIDKTEECNKSLENIHLDSDDTVISLSI